MASADSELLHIEVRPSSVSSFRGRTGLRLMIRAGRAVDSESIHQHDAHILCCQLPTKNLARKNFCLTKNLAREAEERILPVYWIVHDRFKAAAAAV